MDKQEIFEKVADLLVMQLPVKKEDIKAESKLVNELGLDSANIMILVCDIEDEFGIEVDNDMLAKVETVNDIVEYLYENV